MNWKSLTKRLVVTVGALVLIYGLLAAPVSVYTFVTDNAFVFSVIQPVFLLKERCPQFASFYIEYENLWWKILDPWVRDYLVKSGRVKEQ